MASDVGVVNAAAGSGIVAELRSPDVDTCVAAAARLHKEATSEDVPALLQLLATGDFFEREAAAWPLACANCSLRTSKASSEAMTTTGSLRPFSKFLPCFHPEPGWR